MTTTRDSEEVPSVIYPDFTIVCVILALVCFQLPPKFLITQMLRVHDESHPEISEGEGHDVTRKLAKRAMLKGLERPRVFRQASPLITLHNHLLCCLPNLHAAFWPENPADKPTRSADKPTYSATSFLIFLWEVVSIRWR